jgi:hypothetical protein
MGEASVGKSAAELLGLLGGLCALLTGCTSAGGAMPPEDFEASLRRSVDLGDEEIRLAGPGMWLPGVEGFERRPAGSLLPSDVPPSAYEPGGRFGVLILGHCALYFLDWDPETEAYAKRFELPYRSVARRRFARQGSNRRLVLWDLASSVHSFSFLSRWSPRGGTDAALTEKAADLLWERPQRECPR